MTIPLSTGAIELIVNNLLKQNFRTQTVSLESLQNKDKSSSNSTESLTENRIAPRFRPRYEASIPLSPPADETERDE